MNLRGVLYVALGASSYGVLATFVKLANKNHAHTSVLTFSQFFIGALFWVMWSVISSQVKKQKTQKSKPDTRSLLTLMGFGIPLGLVSVFYYLSIQYVPVTVSIILLMQSIWMGLVYEAIVDRRSLTVLKVLGGIVVIGGTLLAVNVFQMGDELLKGDNWKGIALGLLAALCYTLSVTATNRVALHLANTERTKYLVLGGFFTLLIFWNVSIIEHFQWEHFFQWGVFLAVFGTILPPILFTKGFPSTGVGLGSIIAALEIPVSVMSAMIVLGEKVGTVQWIGIIIILVSVFLINYKSLKNR